VRHEEVVYLMPINEFISALGGSLGLFLGFSCLSSFIVLYHCIVKAFQHLKSFSAKKTTK
jgi:hypothetical protein